MMNISIKMTVYVLLILFITEILEARQPDMDINRLKLLPNKESLPGHPLHKHHRQRAIVTNPFRRDNNYDDHSAQLTEQRAPTYRMYDAATTADTKTTERIHQPREDPRLYYQSDAYLKENHQKNRNREVSSIYPGREVVRAEEKIVHGLRSLPIRTKDHITPEGSNFCVKCPHDRTLIAKAGSDKVILQNPRLIACSGRRAPRNMRFAHMYGPNFGSLLPQGSHMVVGQITFKGKTLQMCKMQVNVVVQGCSVPKYLVSECEDGNKSCNFTCQNPKYQLHGSTTLSCGDDMRWNGDLPTCKVRNWCEPPRLPEHGHISCRGATVGNERLAEGSRCRVRCSSGWQRRGRALAVCRRGTWTHDLVCQQKRSHTKSLDK